MAPSGFPNQARRRLNKQLWSVPKNKRTCFARMSLLSRWQPSLWMYLGWPITFLMTVWDMFVAPLLFGPYSLYGRRFQYKEATCEVRSTSNKTSEALACCVNRNHKTKAHSLLWQIDAVFCGNREKSSLLVVGIEKDDDLMFDRPVRESSGYLWLRGTRIVPPTIDGCLVIYIKYEQK